MKIRVPRQKVESLLSDLKQIGGPPKGSHLSSDECVDYLMGLSSPNDVQEFDTHLSSCLKCTTQLAALTDALDFFRRSSRASAVAQLQRRMSKGLTSSHSGAPRSDQRLLRLVAKQGHQVASSHDDEPMETEEAGSVHKSTESSACVDDSDVRPITTAIDIGTSRIRILRGCLTMEGHVRILGATSVPNRSSQPAGLGDPAITRKSLEAALESLPFSANHRSSHTVIGVSGHSTRGCNTGSCIFLDGAPRRISHSDLEEVLTEGPHLSQGDRALLHVLPQDYIVDKKRGLRDPVGRIGSRLAVNFHAVSTAHDQDRSIRALLKGIFRTETKRVFSPLACAAAVLRPNEVRRGVLLIDVGGGTTEYAFFIDNDVQHSAVLPLGGRHFTSDLAMMLRISSGEAEHLKISHGCCLPELVKAPHRVQASLPDGRTARIVSKSHLCEILQARAREIFALVRADLSNHGWDKGWYSGGVVLTGGGSYLWGLLGVCEQVFQSTARRGYPPGIINPLEESAQWSTCVGLLLFGTTVADTTERFNASRWYAQVGSRWKAIADLPPRLAVRGSP